MNNKHSSPYNEFDISRIKRSSNTSPKFSRGILIAQSVKFFTKLAGADFYEFFLPQSVCRFTNIHGRSKERLERRTFPTWPPRFDSTRWGLPGKPGVLTRDSLSSGEWDSTLETTRRDAPSFTQWIREHGIQNRKAIFIIRPSCFYDDTRTKLSRYVLPAIVVDLIHDYFSTRKTSLIDETSFWIRFYPDIVMDLIWEIRQIRHNKIKGNIRIKMCSIYNLVSELQIIS